MNDEKDDIEIEADADLDDSVIAEEHQGDTIKKLREKLKKAEAEAKEYLDGWQRAKADFINIRKRDEEAKREFVKFSKEEIVFDIIPVLDSFDLAFQNKKAWEELPKEWRQGIESIYSQLLSILTNHSIVKDIPLGKTFDPKHHEAIRLIPVTEKDKDHQIIEVFQPGYRIHDKVLRPAKVVVGEYHEDK